MADKPIFTKAGATGSPLTLDGGIAMPYSDNWRVPNQAVAQTYGGELKASKRGVTIRKWKLNIRNISRSNRDALVNFFNDANVDWFLNSFTFEPEGASGNSYTVRLDSDTNLDWPVIRGMGLANVENLVLREVV